MPYVSKEALSQYISTGCKRQLRLYLSPDNARFRAERVAEGMPEPQPPRPGLELFRQQGEAWQAAKLDDLTRTFGVLAETASDSPAVVGDAYPHSTGQTRYRPVELLSVLSPSTAGQFIVEAEYDMGSTCENALEIAGHRATYGLEYARVRPDLIEVLAAGHSTSRVTPSGDVAPLPSGDMRKQLRVVDIKLTAEPSPRYFAEVAYYSILLAGWLEDRGLDGEFVVVPEGALWPGSHDASVLMRTYREAVEQGRVPTRAELRAAMAEDLEPLPFDVFAPRVRRFLREDVQEALSRSWREAPWHVDNRCQGCENLGYPWRDREGNSTAQHDHCMPMAEREGHLSRIAFVTRGASTALRSLGVRDLPALATRTAADPVFESHQELRSMRTVVAGRVQSLATNTAGIPRMTGTSAIMPKWTDLHIYLSADFDQGSAITFAFGIKAFWLEPRPFGANNPNPRAHRAWPAQAYPVDERSLVAEERELLSFLRQIRAILDDARSRNPDTTVQFYVWDTLQYEHLARVIGRHLPAILRDQGIAHLAWLFPPEEVLPNPALVSGKSPITIVREVVRAVLAAPVPHYYTLLDVARQYHQSSLPENTAKFSVHPLFEVALSDQIPSERAHEIWTKATTPRHWSSQLGTLSETVRKRLDALETVTRRLEEDLDLVQAAPAIRLGPPTRQSRLSIEGQLWFAYAKLNDALASIEVAQIRAMPPHEREARFRSARLRRRLTGAAESDALARFGLRAQRGRRVYKMRDASREVKVREGDFGFALAPELEPTFLDRLLQHVAEQTPLLPQDGSGWRTRMEDVTQVTVKAIDREAGVVVIDENARWAGYLDGLEQAGRAQLSANAVLDPVHHDYYTAKLKKSLEAIGNPPIARDNSRVRAALGYSGRGSNRSAHTPPADVLWDAPRMAQTPVARELRAARVALEAAGLALNPSQWKAWECALTRRLQLIWGPPGTGKSRTARAVVTGAALEAARQGRSLRILICASTYNAMDNVLLSVYRDVLSLLPDADIEVHRLRSYLQAPDAAVPVEIDVAVNRHNPSDRVRALHGRLNRAEGITIVGAPPEQVHNLMIADGGSALQHWFDLILIDESSQMDVGHAILALCALATDGSLVLAGDPLQLPPIHPAEPPSGLEYLVGSIYRFCERHHGIAPVMLADNYRSNRELVDFAHAAGYGASLLSYSPDLRLHLLSPLPSTDAPPDDWPAPLYWTPEWSELLDPARPAVCFVYPEGRSSQWNRFEADAVAALVWLLSRHLANGLGNERDPVTGLVRPTTRVPHGAAEFWGRAVGVVTPHRAQQGLIVSRLQELFAESGVAPSRIRDAVDTVERFQGQQRDVMIASFALGDEDAIRTEDEFLLSLNRFNVMASRARAKLIVLVTEEVVNHLSHDLDTLRGSELLKRYVESFCGRSHDMRLGHIEDDLPHTVVGLYKYH